MKSDHAECLKAIKEYEKEAHELNRKVASLQNALMASDRENERLRLQLKLPVEIRNWE